MISVWDDHPIHQAALPVLQPVDGDPNRYDRYFFHGYDVEAARIFVVALGIYPNRNIVDAAFCVSHGGEQRSVFASGRLDPLRATKVGPIEVEVLEPLRRLRVVVDAPDQELAADLTFTARSPAVQEPRQTMMDRERIVMDTCRFTQFGRWEGSLRSGDDEVVVADYAGTRDRSWGIRPLSGATPAAPATDVAGIWWLWSPMQFDDHCVHVALTEAPDGLPVLRGMSIVPDLDGRSPDDASAVEHGRDVTTDITWVPGTRRAQAATLHVHRVAGRGSLEVALEPVAKVFMRGTGYLNFDWAHGDWKGEAEVGGEHLVHDDLDPGDFTLLHVQQVCRATTSAGESGVAVLEQLAIGPHAPSGFVDFMGDATPGAADN